MPTNKSEMLLKLEPIGTNDFIASNKESTQPKDWLHNDNGNIIGINPDDNQPQDLNSVINNIVENSGDIRTIKCPELQICFSQSGYQLLTDQDPTLLKNGDIIALPGINLKVSLIKDHVVSSVETEETTSAPVTDEHDIWSSVTNNQTDSTTINPFISTPENPFDNNIDNLSQDNSLDFLYNNKPNNQLNINAHKDYALSQFPGKESLSEQPLQQNEGNVLQELGIDANQSTIMERQYTNADKSTFLEQSPVDILDEFLDVNDATGQHYYQQPALPNSSKPNTSGLADLADRVKKAAQAFKK